MADLKKARLVFQLPNLGSWFENIAVRPSGTILASRSDVPEIWEIDPVTGKAAVLIAFPNPHSGATGITELAPNIWIVGSGQHSLTTGTVPGSYAVWKLDLSGPASSTSPDPELLMTLPDVGLLNGMTTYDAARGIVLAADSEFGALHAIHVSAKQHAKILDGDALGTPDGAPFKLGINGIKVREGFLYFTNSMHQTMYRVKLVDSNEPGGVRTSGAVEPLASGFGCDDFAFDDDGTAYVATHAEHSVVKIAPGAGEAVTVAGSHDSLEVGGSTACAFGRGKNDQRTLYVVTSGALMMPVNGELREPAKVVAIDVD